MSEPANFGVALSSDNRWACSSPVLHQGEPFFVVDADTLDQSIVWITKAPLFSFVSEYGESRTWLRSGHWLDTGLMQLIDEIDPGVPLVTAQVMSEIVNRVTRIARWLFPEGLDFSKATLSAMLREKMLPEFQVSPRMSGMLLSANRFRPPFITPPTQRMDVIRLHYPRVRLAEKVFDRRIPTGNWEQVNVSAIPGGAKGILRWSVAEDRPVFVRVAFRARRTRSNPGLIRQWVASPELEVLVRHEEQIEFDIEECWAAEGSADLSALMYRPLPAISPMMHGSISFGLFFEALLHGISVASRELYSPPQTWVLSVARATLLEQAIQISRQGGNVTDIGVSHVSIGVRSGEMGAAVDMVDSATCLVVPAKCRWADSGSSAVLSCGAGMKESFEKALLSAIRCWRHDVIMEMDAAIETVFLDGNKKAGLKQLESCVARALR